MKQRLSALLTGLFLVGALACFSGCENRSVKVLASGWADKEYPRAGMPMGDLSEPETYVFFRGVYLAGNRRDDSLDQMPFETICEVLRPHLAAQGYILAASPETADLTIVVNWGMSHVDTEEFEVEAEDLEEGTFAAFGQSQTRDSRLRNARLLGIDDLSKMFTPFAEEDKLRRLDTEQYFFILLGIEMKVVNAMEGRPIKWVTKFSAPITEGPFTEVLPSLARVGATHAGRRTDDSLTRTNLGIGEATMGELQEVEDEAPPPPREAATGTDG